MISLALATVLLAGQATSAVNPSIPHGRFELDDVEIVVIREVSGVSPGDTVHISGAGHMHLSCPDSSAHIDISPSEVAWLLEDLCSEDFFSLRSDYTWYYRAFANQDGTIDIGHIEDTTGSGEIEIRVRLGSYEKSVVSFRGLLPFDRALEAIDTSPSVKPWRRAMYEKALE